ncbi:unnamed protein product [Cylindrotheca closterium]|uniref:TATA-binding protein interacting (TIP20) domain-containing protein n=1 Tax=Cylindrotheca closterium TaxID=2856 RepID=A0AAD2G9Z6_9STRA|nr:unnamed protein product [Cylindrotheca closterium]
MSTSSSSASINALLKKTEHYDKDERYMATSDLCEVLKRHSSGDSLSVLSDSSTERRICTAVLRLLHDKSNDVQAIAVKTLGVLLTTVKEEQVLEIADSLTDQVLDASKSELRDVYAIGLRTLVKTIPPSMGDLTSKRLVGRLLDGIRTSQNEEIVLACLDILTDLLGRFGASAVSVTRQHEPILQMCLQQLVGPSLVVRKRAGNTIGCLSVVLSDALLGSMVERLLSQIDSAAGNPDDTRALIRTMCTVSGAVGHRLQQPQIDRILPIFLKFTNPHNAMTGDDEDDMSPSVDYDMQDEAAVAVANELKESCFMGFASFVTRCPTQVEPHLEKIIEASLAYMSYDPNYSYGDDDEDAGEDESGEYDDESGDDEYEDEDSEDDDDDDESWKVRRSAIRTLKAVVEAKRHSPAALWTVTYKTRQGQAASVAMALVTRFKEREENCRSDVLDCFTKLLSVTVDAAKAGFVTLASDDMDTGSVTSIDLRTKYAPSLVKGCEKLLGVKKGGGERSKSNALVLLSTLCKAPGGIGGEHAIISVFQHIRSFLADSDSHTLHRETSSKTLRLDALSLVFAMLSCGNHDPVHIRKGLTQILLPPLCEAVKEQWYKVIAQALRALAAAPQFFVDGFNSNEQSEEEKLEEMNEVANKIFLAIKPLLAVHDVDQEIKECALEACACLLGSLHSNLSVEQKNALLGLVLERLKNETTRISAIKTLSSICDTNPASTQGKIDLSSMLRESIETMAGFLKLQSRSLKQSSLEALDTMIKNHGAGDDKALYSRVLEDLAHLIADSDLHISHLSLRVSHSVLKICPGCGPAVKGFVLPQALALSTSPLLQDLALESLLALLQQVVVSEAVDFEELMGMLRGRLDEASPSKHAIYNLGRCIAIITASTTEVHRQKLIAETLTLLEGSKTPSDRVALKKVQLAILVSGDLGRAMDLSSIPGVADALPAIYMGYFDSGSEDLKHSAAYSLGRATVQAQSTFLPAVVEALEKNGEKKQYLLLSALREFIQCSDGQKGGAGVNASLQVILPHLEKHSSDDEEGIRTMVAECFGSLACMQPSPILKLLAQIAHNHSAITTKDGTVDGVDTASQKNALVVGDLMKESIMPSLYKVAELKMERKVDLGPFTHKVDDALPLRKAALSIFATCLEKLPGTLDMNAFMPVLAKALSDVEDIQLQAHQIVISMCVRQPTHITSSVESFVDPLEKTMHKKPGQKTGTELERLNEWIKSAIRTMTAMGRVQGTMNSRKFAEFYERTKANSKFRAIFDALDEEK